jgi:hypothetical protein
VLNASWSHERQYMMGTMCTIACANLYHALMHQACVRHIDASGLCTTHRCIRLVCDTSMQSRRTTHVHTHDASEADAHLAVFSLA